MHWLAIALVAIFLLWRFPRRTIQIVVVLTALGAVAGTAAWIYEESERKARNKEIENFAVEIKPDSSCGADMPIHVKIKNNNTFSIDNVSLAVSAKAAGRSTELYSDYFPSDYILAPGKILSLCFSPVSHKAPGGKIEGNNPSDLIWSAKVSYITKSK